MQKQKHKIQCYCGNETSREWVGSIERREGYGEGRAGTKVASSSCVYCSLRKKRIRAWAWVSASASARLGVQTKTQFYCVEWASIAIYSERVREYTIYNATQNTKHTQDIKSANKQVLPRRASVREGEREWMPKKMSACSQTNTN